MKVLIADDEAPARQRLRAMLGELSDWEVAAEAGDGRSANLAAARIDRQHCGNVSRHQPAYKGRGRPRTPGLKANSPPWRGYRRAVFLSMPSAAVVT